MDNPESNKQKLTRKRTHITSHRRKENVHYKKSSVLIKVQLSKIPEIIRNKKQIESIANFLYELTSTKRNPSENAKKNYRIFLKKARVSLSDSQETSKKKKLLECIDNILSAQDEGKNIFTNTMQTITNLTASKGYNELYKEITQADSSSDDADDDDNRPSSSNNINMKRSQESVTSQSPRKRRASIPASNILNQDPDFGFEPPLAKRQQILPSIYQSQPDSVASSSSLDDILAYKILAKRNSSDVDSRNDAASADAGEILDSPDPNECHSDEETNSKRSSNPFSPSHFCELAESSSDETISQTSSPYPTHFRQTESELGEQTPASCLLEQDSNTVDSNEQQKIPPFDDFANSIFDCMTPAAETDPPRQCPLPALSWANAQDVWHTMCKRDEIDTCLRDAGMLDRHPGLQPRMRAILLDWLIEVCEVYKLHRETYYLAVDYLDRFLTSKSKVQKTHLQLIGITCLFVAAKVEEIYPPKIGEFAYVTDGACREQDILHNEILLLQALDWDINPVTPMGWLGVYMQLNVNNRTPKTLPPKNLIKQKENKPNALVNAKDEGGDCIDEGFIYPQFSGFKFAQTAQLLDLCSLDVGVAHFPYSVLAAAAMSHTFNRETALRCSGLDWLTIQRCARWMEPYFVVISSESDNLYMMEQNEQVPSKFGLGHICSNITTDDSHIIQTHTITMNMFDRATAMQEELLSMANEIKTEASPAIGLICPEGLLTPPASSRKPLDVLDEDHTKTTVKSTVPTTNKILPPVNNGSSELNNKSTATSQTTKVTDEKQKTT